MSDFITYCPACSTHFKVQEEVLAASAGKGRCNACRHVFNAFEHRFEPGVSEASVETPVSELEIPDAETPSFDQTYIEEDTAALADLLIDTDALEAKPEHIPEPLPVIPVPETLFQKQRINWTRFFKPLGVIIFLLLLLLLQSALFFRAALVAHYPRSYSMLASSCKLLHCSVELPHNAHLINIEDHNLRSDPEHADVLVLEGSIKNIATYPQAYPLLQLTLTTQPNSPVASRSFSPEEYLAKGSDVAAGIAVGRMANIHMNLGVAGIQSSAYQLITKDAPKANAL
ncbi:MAG: zinc-ribbon and DUF3426 domain-containing protein [Methylophilaceae bacterium]